MTKYLIAVIAALTVALAASGWLHLKQAKNAGELAQRLDVAEATIKATKAAAKRADAAVLRARQEHAKADKAAEATGRAVAAALEAEPTWGSTPVPEAILEAIHAADSHGLPAGLDRLFDSVTDPIPAPVSPAGAVPRAAPVDQDERRPTDLGSRPAASAAEVQY